MSHKNHENELKIEVEKTLRPEEAAIFFADLSRQIRERRDLTFTEGDRTLTMELKSNMFMEMKAKSKKGKYKLAIEMEWVSEPAEGLGAGPTDPGMEDPEAEDPTSGE